MLGVAGEIAGNNYHCEVDYIVVSRFVAGIAGNTVENSVVHMTAAAVDEYCTCTSAVVDIAEVERIALVAEVGCTAGIVDTGIAGGIDTAALVAPCLKGIRY